MVKYRKGKQSNLYFKKGVLYYEDNWQDYCNTIYDCVDPIGRNYTISLLLCFNHTYRCIGHFGLTGYYHVFYRLYSQQLHMGDGICVPTFPLWHTSDCRVVD